MHGTIVDPVSTFYILRTMSNMLEKIVHLHNVKGIDEEERELAVLVE